MARNPIQRRKMVAAVVAMWFELIFRVIVHLSGELENNLLESSDQDKVRETQLARQLARTMFMNSIVRHGDISCVMLVQMNCRCFRKLCTLLSDEGGLKPSLNVPLDEMVAMFLYTVAHNEKNRQLQITFRRSGETISRVIHRVVMAVLKLNKLLLRKPVPVAADSSDPRWKHFPKCLGAIDGTLINVRVPIEEQRQYRTRKGTLAMNVLGVCNQNMEFIYCLAGWEGSAHDSRVLRDAISRNVNGFKVPKGCYYLCDAGYSNSDGFLAPYRSQRYHLKEWGRNRPTSPQEMFNMRHSSARNTIERAFGILKMRWAILRDTTWFSPDMVAKIFNACALLHNFIRGEVGADAYERLYTDEHQGNAVGNTNDEYVTEILPSNEWTQFRQDMAQHMWDTRGWGAGGDDQN